MLSPMIQTKEIPVPEEITKSARLLKVVAVESPTPVPEHKLFIRLQVDLFDEQGNPQISLGEAREILEGDQAKRLAIYETQKRLSRQCGYSDQSQITTVNEKGEPITAGETPFAVQIVYSVLGAL